MLSAYYSFILLYWTTGLVIGGNAEYLAPLHGLNVRDKWPHEYLVILHENHTLEAHFLHIGRNLSDTLQYHKYSFGYQATMDETTRDQLVRRDPGVEMLETNRPYYGVKPHDVQIVDHDAEDVANASSRLTKRNYRTTVQDVAPYGLQMLTSPAKRLDIPVENDGSYEYLATAGRGVQVYVMDTGIRTTHKLFRGRARHFGGLGPDDISPYVDAPMADKRGHGTHVAGIIGAEQYGVAPLVDLINVKVLDDRGTVGRDLGKLHQAIMDIIAEHNKNKAESFKNPNSWKFRGSVINMSFAWVGQGFGILRALIAANEAGISVFAAAGNKNDDQGDWYPCANVQTRCIAAVDNTYHKWKGSNYGPTIDFVAPGKDVLSTGHQHDRGVIKMSGTSQAAPHAAGAAAIFASWKGLETKGDLSHKLVWWNSISDVVTGFKPGTQTYLINTGIHHPKKYPHEPFRWAYDDPQRPHAIDGLDVSGTSDEAPPQSPPAGAFMTGFYTDMATKTTADIPGLETFPGVVEDLTFNDETTTNAQPTSIPPDTPARTPKCAPSGLPFDQAAAQKLISTFCEQSFLNSQFVPRIALGNGTTQAGQPKTTNAQGNFKIDDTGNRLWFRTRFTTRKCTGTFKGSSQCAERFSTILNGCQTDTITAKLGGTLSSVCANYDLVAVDEHTDPFTDDDDDDDVGDFTCKDTASPMDTLYPNTCTCWMSKRDGQVAMFVKPMNGACDGKSVNQEDGLAPGQGY